MLSEFENRKAVNDAGILPAIKVQYISGHLHPGSSHAGSEHVKNVTFAENWYGGNSIGNSVNSPAKSEPARHSLSYDGKRAMRLQ